MPFGTASIFGEQGCTEGSSRGDIEISLPVIKRKAPLKCCILLFGNYINPVTYYGY